MSPTSYYLFGDLAHMELNLVQKISTHLEQSGFVQYSCSDMVRTPVVVGTFKFINLKLNAVDFELLLAYKA